MKCLNMKLLLVSLITMGLGVAANAQISTVSNDSIKVLQYNKDLAKLNVDLYEEKMKLAQSQNDLIDLRADLQKANEKAAQSAADSKDAASKMSDNVGDKAAAKKAKKDADRAAGDNKQAVRLTSKVADKEERFTRSEKNISEIQKKTDKVTAQYNK